MTIEVPEQVYKQAQRWAAFEDRPIAQVIADALERYEQDRRKQLTAEYHAALERLYADPVAAAEEQAEIELWDAVSLYDLNRSLAEEEGVSEDER